MEWNNAGGPAAKICIGILALICTETLMLGYWPVTAYLWLGIHKMSIFFHKWKCILPVLLLVWRTEAWICFVFFAYTFPSNAMTPLTEGFVFPRFQIICFNYNESDEHKHKSSMECTFLISPDETIMLFELIRNYQFHLVWDMELLFFNRLQTEL